MKLKRLASIGILNGLILICLVCLLEGAVSLVQVLGKIRSPMRRAKYTQYDPMLGWKSEPNRRVADIFGAGIDLNINSAGARGTREYGDAPPPGKVRVLCSGDSFTLAVGVGDQETWCDILSSIDPRAESINMGMGGYGIDQAYLWYKQAGSKFKPGIHLFAFVDDDFRRATLDSFLGYPKPRFDLENGKLVLQNVPVPRTAYFAPWITENLDALKSLRLAETLFRFAANEGADSNKRFGEMPAQALPLGLKVLDEVNALDSQNNTRLILVMLPTQLTYRRKPNAQWRDQLREALAARKIRYLDLSSEFDDVDPDKVRQFYIPNHPKLGVGVAHHYTVLGNQRVAHAVLRYLEKDLASGPATGPR